MPLTRLAGSVETFVLRSAALMGNLLGDPPERDVHVYLPPNYATGKTRFPAVLMLPGFGSLSRTFLPKELFRESVVERFDRLLRDNLSPPALLVMPEAATRYGGSQFIDSPVTGRYQHFLADEVIPEVDRRYRTVPDPTARGALGTSSGGFGALRLALDRRDAVSVVASIAGDAAFEVSLRPLIPRVAAALARAGGAALFLREIARVGPGDGDYDPLFFIAAAQAYAPEPQNPFPHAALPFDMETCAIDDAVWQRYLAHDPLHRLNQNEDSLAHLQHVFLDAGRWDEYGLQFAARRLRHAFEARDVPVTLSEFDGGHRGAGHRVDTLLPQLVARLSGRAST